MTGNIHPGGSVNLAVWTRGLGGSVIKLDISPKQDSLLLRPLGQVGGASSAPGPQLSIVLKTMPRPSYLPQEWLWRKLLVPGLPAEQSVPTVLMVGRM